MGVTQPSIRPTGPGEEARLRQIESDAGQAFSLVGLAEVADYPPLTLADHAEYRRRGRSWVATHPDDRPVAFLVADLVDGNAHIDEVAVDPAHAGSGIGRALIDHLVAWAATNGLPAVTLTTFVEVPWNAPYYRRCGFRSLDDTHLPPGLARIRESERGTGPGREPPDGHGPRRLNAARADRSRPGRRREPP